MPTLTLLPAVYIAALIFAIGSDFLRAQLSKDLEYDPPDLLRRTIGSVSLPTICLVGALLLRVLIHVKGLLLTALLVAAALFVWKTYRLWALPPGAPVTSRRSLP